VDTDLPVYQLVRFALQRLGHAEFYVDNGENRWRVVPPTAAFFPNSNRCALLCGARSPSLLNALLKNSKVNISCSDVEGMPQRIVLQGTSDDAIAMHATALGLCIQRSAPIAILSVVPTVRDPSVWLRSAFPETPGWLVHHFSGSRLQWAEVPQAEAIKEGKGLFRFIQKHQRFYYLRRKDVSYQVPVQVGKYAVLRKRHGNLTYDADRRIVSVPAMLRPPLLVERALVLCSGRLPGFDAASGHIQYSEIPPAVIQLVGQLLCQEVK
jgi:hypothetical protein